MSLLLIVIVQAQFVTNTVMKTEDDLYMTLRREQFLSNNASLLQPVLRVLIHNYNYRSPCNQMIPLLQPVLRVLASEKSDSQLQLPLTLQQAQHI